MRDGQQWGKEVTPTLAPPVGQGGGPPGILPAGGSAQQGSGLCPACRLCLPPNPWDLSLKASAGKSVSAALPSGPLPQTSQLTLFGVTLPFLRMLLLQNSAYQVPPRDPRIGLCRLSPD